MKIYPSRDNIVSTKQINLNSDIPLAYIDTNATEYNINIIPYLQKDEKREVIPFTSFPTDNIKFFDKDNYAFKKIKLRHNGTKYYLDPSDIENTASFLPKEFLYNVVVKKKMEYSSSQKYNLKIGCIDNTPDLELSKSMIGFFDNVPNKNFNSIRPNNISINNGDISLNSLHIVSNDTAISDKDFIFIAPDKKNLNINFNLDKYLEQHANVWMIVDNMDGYEVINSLTTVSVVDPKVARINNVAYERVFNINNFAGEGKIVYNIFDNNLGPIVIYEKVGQGFVILSTQNFFENINKNNNANLMYEVLMRVFTKAYKKSKTYYDWITDTMPDFIYNNELVKRKLFTSKLKVYEMFDLKKDDLEIQNIKIKIKLNDTTFVPEEEQYVFVDGYINDYIIFKKVCSGPTAKYLDPTVNKGTTTIYIPGKGIISIPYFIYTVEESILNKINWKVMNDKVVFNIKPFKSSINNIDILSETNKEFLLLDEHGRITEAELYICFNANKIEVVTTNLYNESYGLKIAKAIITQKASTPIIYDIRQRGGGLPEKLSDNFNLLDIANINGRPYRKGGTLVIKVPERLKPYNDLILTAIKKHMIAEDYPVIVYEKEES